MWPTQGSVHAVYHFLHATYWIIRSSFEQIFAYNFNRVNSNVLRHKNSCLTWRKVRNTVAIFVNQIIFTFNNAGGSAVVQLVVGQLHLVTKHALSILLTENHESVCTVRINCCHAHLSFLARTNCREFQTTLSHVVLKCAWVFHHCYQ